jgi:hypothetical protein
MREIYKRYETDTRDGNDGEEDKELEEGRGRIRARRDASVLPTSSLIAFSLITVTGDRIYIILVRFS